MNTRIAGLGIEGRHIKSVLLPVFDLINHGKVKNVDLEAYWTKNGELGYKVHALDSIKKGQELYVHYGQLNDLSLLQKYGFTLGSANFSTSAPKTYISFSEAQSALTQISSKKSSLLKGMIRNCLFEQEI